MLVSKDFMVDTENKTRLPTKALDTNKFKKNYCIL